MTARDILLSNSILNTGTAVDVFRAIEAGIIYVRDTRYVNSGMSNGADHMLVDVTNDVIVGEVDVDSIQADVSVDNINAIIVDSYKG